MSAIRDRKNPASEALRKGPRTLVEYRKGGGATSKARIRLGTKTDLQGAKIL